MYFEDRVVVLNVKFYGYGGSKQYAYAISPSVGSSEQKDARTKHATKRMRLADFDWKQYRNGPTKISLISCILFQLDAAGIRLLDYFNIQQT